MKTDNLFSHFATSSWGGHRKLPYVFTERAVAMLSSVRKEKQVVDFLKDNPSIKGVFMKTVLNTVLLTFALAIFVTGCGKSEIKDMAQQLKGSVATV